MGIYTNVENSQANAADTERASLSVGISRQLNSIVSMGLTGHYERMLDGDGSEKYDRYQLGLSFSRQFVDSNIDLSAGRTLVVPEVSEKVGSNYVSLSFTREKLWLHDVTVNYLEDISDTSIGFAVSGLDANQFAVQGNDIVTRKSVELNIKRILSVYKYNLSFAWDYEDYEVQNSDEKEKNASFSLSKDMLSNFSTEVNFEFNQTEYLGLVTIGKENTRTYRVRGDYQFSQDLSMGSYIQHELRQNARNALREYEELSVGINLNWTLL